MVTLNHMIRASWHFFVPHRRESTNKNYMNWSEDDGTYLHAVCRGVSSSKTLLIAFFGSTPAAITRRTLSRSPSLQALKSSLSSSARRVDIFRSDWVVSCDARMWVGLYHHYACAQSMSITWRDANPSLLEHDLRDKSWEMALLDSMVLVPSVTSETDTNNTIEQL